MPALGLTIRCVGRAGCRCCRAGFHALTCPAVQITKAIKWDVKKINPTTPITLRGSVCPSTSLVGGVRAILTPCRRWLAAFYGPWRTTSRRHYRVAVDLQHSNLYLLGVESQQTGPLWRRASPLPLVVPGSRSFAHRIRSMQVKYKPFKGVKYNTVAGRYQIRC